MHCTCDFLKLTLTGVKDPYFPDKHFPLKQVPVPVRHVLQQKANGHIYPFYSTPSLKTIKETPLMQWQKQLIPIIRSFNTSSQIRNGISRQSNAQDWKSFKNKELLLPRKTDFSPSLIQAARNPLQKRPRGQRGNIAGHSKGKRSAMRCRRCFRLTIKAFPHQHNSLPS